MWNNTANGLLNFDLVPAQMWPRVRGACPVGTPAQPRPCVGPSSEQWPIAWARSYRARAGARRRVRPAGTCRRACSAFRCRWREAGFLPRGLCRGHLDDRAADGPDIGAAAVPARASYSGHRDRAGTCWHYSNRSCHTARTHDVATATHPSSLSTSGAIQHGLPSTCGSTQSTPCAYLDYPL